MHRMYCRETLQLFTLYSLTLHQSYSAFSNSSRLQTLMIARIEVGYYTCWFIKETSDQIVIISVY